MPIKGSYFLILCFQKNTTLHESVIPCMGILVINDHEWSCSMSLAPPPSNIRDLPTPWTFKKEQHLEILGHFNG